MSAKNARGTATRSKPRQSSRGSKARKGAPAAVIDTLPLPAETVRRVTGWILTALFLAFVLAVLVALRVPQMGEIALGEAIGRAGFTLHHVEPKGLSRLNPMQVYGAAADQLDRPMPLVDLDATRQRLLRFGWVRDARVSRRFPDTLVVDVVERTPAAIWQYNQQLTLIDADGVALERVPLEAMPDLPLVIGPAANRHAAEFSRLLAAAPELKPIIAGATWIGDRRWDIRFHSGETLALPEGGDNAARALAKFAQLDRSAQLLGRGLVRFDMRIPGKLIVRVSNEPGTIVPDLENAPPAGSSDQSPPPASAQPAVPPTSPPATTTPAPSQGAVPSAQTI